MLVPGALGTGKEGGTIPVSSDAFRKHPVATRSEYLLEVSHACEVDAEFHPHTISQFRSIALLNVEGKIFFSVLARRRPTFSW